MKTKKVSYIIIGLIILLIAVGVAYAAFIDVLDIRGTATVSGDFVIEFTNVTDPNNVATISEDKKSIIVNAQLAFPGDSITISPEVSNKGSINAKITGIKILDAVGGSTYSNPDITVTTSGIVSNDLLNSGAKNTFNVVMTWVSESTATKGTTANFVIELDYVQNT